MPPLPESNDLINARRFVVVSSCVCIAYKDMCVVDTGVVNTSDLSRKQNEEGKQNQHPGLVHTRAGSRQNSRISYTVHPS